MFEHSAKLRQLDPARVILVKRTEQRAEPINVLVGDLERTHLREARRGAIKIRILILAKRE